MGTCSNAPSGWCDDTGCAVKGCKLEHRSSKELCQHSTLYTRDMFTQPQPWGHCLLCERDRLRGELEAAEQHVRILQERRTAHEPPADDGNWRQFAEAMYSACCYLDKAIPVQGYPDNATRVRAAADEIERLQQRVTAYREVAGCALNGTDEADELSKLPTLDRERETYRRVQQRGLASMKAAADAAQRAAVEPAAVDCDCGPQICAAPVGRRCVVSGNIVTAPPPAAARRIELLNLLDDRERKHDAFSLAEQSGKYAEELRSFDEAHCAVLDWVTDHADELLPLLRATPPPNCVHPFAKLGIDGDGVMWCVQCLTKPLVIPVPFGETVPPTVPLPMLSDMYKLYDALRQVGELNWPFDKDHHAVLNMIDEKYGRQMGDLLDDDGNPVACRWKPPERLVHPCIGPNCVLCQSESRPIETSEPLCLHGRPYSRGCTDCGRTRAPLSENKGDQS